MNASNILLSRQGQYLLQIRSMFQETFIKVLAYSSAPTGLTCFALILWGLRAVDKAPAEQIANA